MTDLELVLSIIVFGVLMYFCPSLLSDERKPTLNEFKCHCDAENRKCPKKRIPCRRMIFGNKNAYGKKNGRITNAINAVGATAVLCQKISTIHIESATSRSALRAVIYLPTHGYFSRTSVQAQITRPAITLSQSPA